MFLIFLSLETKHSRCQPEEAEKVLGFFVESGDARIVGGDIGFSVFEAVLG